MMVGSVCVRNPTPGRCMGLDVLLSLLLSIGDFNVGDAVTTGPGGVGVRVRLLCCVSGGHNRIHNNCTDRLDSLFTKFTAGWWLGAPPGVHHWRAFWWWCELGC